MRKTFEEQPSDFEIDEEEVANELQKARWLLGWLGATNLSNIEIFHLRNDIVQSLKEGAYLHNKFTLNEPLATDEKDFDTIRLNKTIAFEEAVARFLGHYGIEMGAIHFKFDQKVPLSDQIIMDPAGRKYIKNKLAIARQSAHKPFLDL